ncbi:hypothetical protein OJ252_3549 [Cryptosporidium canis]|uniref:ER membrane protein complex subunit 4 n=1 Tax=Cryptosporidium canis TaxID=195482 RepID=A0ABQ8P201_9CRYT|nr:hypothetical protein OJ252_3549 [Cryptosporidium canis]
MTKKTQKQKNAQFGNDKWFTHPISAEWDTEKKPGNYSKEYNGEHLTKLANKGPAYYQQPEQYEKYGGGGKDEPNQPQNDLSGCSKYPKKRDIEPSPINQSSICNFNKKAWAIAHLPLKTMSTSFFMLYMSGKGSGIFSILITSYALVNTIKLMTQLNKAFVEIEQASKQNFILQKAVYFTYSLIGVVFVIYKLGTMGLIPVNRGDFFSDIPQHTFPTHGIGT